MLHLDSQHRLIETDEMPPGTVDTASVYPRQVVKEALVRNSAAVTFAHNNSSRVAEPGAADRVLTDKLRDPLTVVEIRALDHFVVGGTTTTSLAERGWL